MLARNEAPTRASFPRLLPALVVVGVAAMAALPACREKAAPQTTAPAGFRVVRDADAGFAVAVPAGWQRIPLPKDLDEFDKTANELSGRNPRLRPAVVQARQLLQFGGRLMVVSPDGGSVVNLTVDKATEKNLAEIGRTTADKLREGGATDLTQEQTTSGAGPALKLTFRYPIEGQEGREVQADEIQYLVLHKGRSFVLTVINGAGDLAATVAASLRLR